MPTILRTERKETEMTMEVREVQTDLWEFKRTSMIDSCEPRFAYVFFGPGGNFACTCRPFQYAGSCAHVDQMKTELKAFGKHADRIDLADRKTEG